MVPLRPRLLLLSASPRPRSNTLRIAQAVAGAFTDWDLVQLPIHQLFLKPCRGCFRCQRGLSCTQKDDMASVLQHLDTAAAILLASPVYFYGFPGYAKILIDRCHPLWNSSSWTRRPKRPALLVATCGASRLDEFAVLRREAAAFFNTIAGRPVPPLLIPGLQSASTKKRVQSALRRARTLGRRLHAQWTLKPMP
jgi:hypothetical protein